MASIKNLDEFVRETVQKAFDETTICGHPFMEIVEDIMQGRLIYRRDVLDAIADHERRMESEDELYILAHKHLAEVVQRIIFPPGGLQPTCNQLATDTIGRQAAIDALHMHLMYRMGTDSNKKRLDDWINGVPSVQPERTCVNCGRTANNGGWYADGRTRCPIEEHYALPKDGYCHLWEKRNITDDDYPERREE